MRRRLEAHGFSDDEVRRAIGTALEAGLLDDRAFARLWVVDRVEHRPLARSAVARELREKGVPPAIAESALAEAYPPELERKLIWRLARERLHRLAGIEPEARERRTIGYLTRRGFSFSEVRGIVAQEIRSQERREEATDE